MSDETQGPKHLVLTTAGRDYRTPDGNASVVFMDTEHFEREAVRQVVEYVRQFGTLDKLTVVGHGNSMLIASLEKATSRDQVLLIPRFLDELKRVQALTGLQLTKSIEFDACSTMTELSPVDVSYLRQSAKELGAAIVGYTTVGLNIRTRGDHAQGVVDRSTAKLSAVFEPDGSVHRGEGMSGWQRYNYLSEMVGQGEWLHGNRTLLRLLTMA